VAQLLLAVGLRRLKRRTAVGVSIALGVLMVLTGCKVGPNYARPQSALPERFVEQTSSSAPEVPAQNGSWWKAFNDPALDELIAQALQHSPDLDIARARVVEARAERAAVAGQLLPEIDAEGGYTRQHGSANVPIGTPPGGLGLDVTSSLWLAGFDASWELDVFGGTRRAIESADAALTARMADREDAELTLAAEIARDYVELRTQQLRLSIAREILLLRQDSLKLASAQFDSGLASALDPVRARAELADSEAEVPILEAAVRAAIYRLGVLVGTTSESLVPQLTPDRAVPVIAGTVPVGLPSDLLTRRPDIRAAERRIAEANARIGAREADLYPHFSLTGVAGFESLYAGQFLVGPSRYYSVGPSISWLVFDAGRIRDEVLAERARTDVVAAQYRKTVLGALGEVESALVTYGRSEIQRQALEREVVQRRDAVDLAQRLYANGLENYLTVLDAERTLRAAEMSQAGADQGHADAFIALVKALGGGWASP
jgi:outer membrane protein, multidrug efflux system